MIPDVHIERFGKALQAVDPTAALYDLAVMLRDEGVSQVDLMALYTRFQVQTSGDDPRYDAIVDTMDLIHGGPWAKGRDSFPTELEG